MFLSVPSRTPAMPTHVHSLTRMSHACRLLCAAYVAHDGMRRIRETELASLFASALTWLVANRQAPFAARRYAFYDYD